MKKKERVLIFELSKCTLPPLVKNPADIQQKMMFYGEMEKLGHLLRDALYELSDPLSSMEDKVSCTKKVKDFCKKLQKKHQN